MGQTPVDFTGAGVGTAVVAVAAPAADLVAVGPAADLVAVGEQYIASLTGAIILRLTVVFITTGDADVIF